VRVGGVTKLLRTSPPHSLAGVDAMQYEGAYPISKLTVQDGSLSAAGVGDLEVYALSAVMPHQPVNKSMAPAVAFTLRMMNPTTTPLQVLFLLSLPLAVNNDTSRAPDATHESSSIRLTGRAATSATECKAACDANATCASWSREPGVPAACADGFDGSRFIRCATCTGSDPVIGSISDAIWWVSCGRALWHWLGQPECPASGAPDILSLEQIVTPDVLGDLRSRLAGNFTCAQLPANFTPGSHPSPPGNNGSGSEDTC
jgi:hypothetical protein